VLVCNWKCSDNNFFADSSGGQVSSLLSRAPNWALNPTKLLSQWAALSGSHKTKRKTFRLTSNRHHWWTSQENFSLLSELLRGTRTLFNVVVTCNFHQYHFLSTFHLEIKMFSSLSLHRIVLKASSNGREFFRRFVVEILARHQSRGLMSTNKNANFSREFHPQILSSTIRPIDEARERANRAVTNVICRQFRQTREKNPSTAPKSRLEAV
jgi:hypothetical protein